MPPREPHSFLSFPLPLLDSCMEIPYLPAGRMEEERVREKRGREGNYGKSLTRSGGDHELRGKEKRTRSMI